MLRGPVWISSQHARYRRMIDFKKKKLFLLDMDGTIYLGDRLFEGTAEFLKAVRRQGGKYLFVTNNSSRSVDAYIERLQRLGIASERDDFLTSVDALIMFLRNGYEKKLIYAAGTKTFREQLQTAGFHITTECTEAVELLVNGFDTELSFQKLEDACRLLTRGVEWIATNPDGVGFRSGLRLCLGDAHKSDRKKTSLYRKTGAGYGTALHGALWLYEG